MPNGPVEYLLEQAPRAERPEQRERGHVARDHERQRRRDGEDAPAWKVGADDEPRERDSDHGGGGGHREDERPGLQQELAGAVPPEDAPGVTAALGGADGEVCERQEDETGRQAGYERERKRRPPPWPLSGRPGGPPGSCA